MRFGQGLNKAGFYFRWYLAALYKAPVRLSPRLGFFICPQRRRVSNSSYEVNIKCPENLAALLKMWAGSHSFSIPFVSPLIYNNHMRTIDELVNEMYMDNEQHLEYMENMNGGDCDCNIHTTLNTIVKYWWDEEK